VSKTNAAQVEGIEKCKCGSAMIECYPYHRTLEANPLQGHRGAGRKQHHARARSLPSRAAASKASPYLTVKDDGDGVPRDLTGCLTSSMLQLISATRSSALESRRRWKAAYKGNLASVF